MKNRTLFCSDVINHIISSEALIVQLEDPEERDMEGEKVHWMLQGLEHEYFTAVELKAIIAVANTFKYDTKALEVAYSKQVRRETQLAHVYYDYDLALAEVEERKQNQIDDMWVFKAVFEAQTQA